MRAPLGLGICLALLVGVALLPTLMRLGTGRSRPAVAAHAVGLPAPVLSGPRVDGQAGSLDLIDLRGRPVLVEFWATWCPSCAEHAALSAALAREAPAGLQVLMVALDGAGTAAEVPAWLRQCAPGVPAIHQPHAAGPWEVDAVPAFFLIDAQGHLAASRLLAADGARTEAAIRAALAALTHLPEHA